jgi:hypothetical protein
MLKLSCGINLKTINELPRTLNHSEKSYEYDFCDRTYIYSRCCFMFGRETTDDLYVWPTNTAKPCA